MTYQRTPTGYPVPGDQATVDAYGLIPEAIDGLFQDMRPGRATWERPKRIIHWQHSATFNRWSALVEFEDGYQTYTWPKLF